MCRVEDAKFGEGKGSVDTDETLVLRRLPGEYRFNDLRDEVGDALRSMIGSAASVGVGFPVVSALLGPAKLGPRINGCGLMGW